MLETNTTLPTLSLDGITLKNRERWRKDLDEDGIKELAESIDKFGLFHAIVVQNDGHTLVAGRRRFAAISLLAHEGKQIRYNGKLIRLGQVPVIKLEELAHPDYKEAELDENIRRTDFSWQERAHAVNELHQLRKRQAEEVGNKHHQQDTAKEVALNSNDKKSISRSYTEVKEDLLVAAYMDDPDIYGAGDRKEALKILRRKLEIKHRQALAREFDAEKLKTPHKVLHGDLLLLMKKLPAHEYDCIIADPPYGMNADTFSNQSAVQHKYNDSEEYSNEILACIANEGMRITKFKAHAYIFCDINRFDEVKKIFEHYGWYVWNTPFIWSKGVNVGVAPRPNHGPRRTYEAIVYCIKNDKRVHALYSDVLNVPHDKTVQYGAHKPPEVYKNLLSRSCLPGDKVIDPCCGTGPVFPAAEELKVIATGIEVGEEGFGYSVARIRKFSEGVEDA